MSHTWRSLKYLEGDRRKYFLADLTPERLQRDLRFVTSVEDPAATDYTERSFVVEDGVVGVWPA